MPAEPERLESLPRLCPGATEHTVRHPYQAPPPVLLAHLPVVESIRHVPAAPPTMLDPLPKVGGQGILGQHETSAGHDRHRARSQRRHQGMDHRIRGLLRAGTEMEHGHDLGGRIDNEPSPEDRAVLA